MGGSSNPVKDLVKTVEKAYQDTGSTIKKGVEQVDDATGNITGILTILLGAIASISLLVGGIGIMNIMLVSVTERTREIGTRLAIGARESDILTQFLIEAVTLSLAGGTLGVLLGVIGNQIIYKVTNFYIPTALYSILIGFAPLLMLLKKEPCFGTLDIAPHTLPLIKKTRLSPLLILCKYF